MKLMKHTQNAVCHLLEAAAFIPIPQAISTLKSILSITATEMLVMPNLALSQVIRLKSYLKKDGATEYVAAQLALSSNHDTLKYHTIDSLD